MWNGLESGSEIPIVQNQETEKPLMEGFESVLEVLDIPGLSPESTDDGEYCEQAN